MSLNQRDKKKVEDFYKGKKSEVLNGTLYKIGNGRTIEHKESNFVEIRNDLQALGLKNTRVEIAEAASILSTIVGNRPVEIQEPPNDNGAARKLAVVQTGSSTVRHVIAGVDVRLDNDQLKHQDLKVPIGTRHKGGGNRFDSTCDATWHQTITMAHMAAWANNLGAMNQGDIIYHGQSVPVNQVHYEGYCLFDGVTKYVIFHCYPSNDSPLLGQKG